MKNKIFIALFIFCSCSTLSIYSQNWTTHCGNNERNGLSKLIGPEQVQTPLWTINNATPSSISMNIYAHGNRFVTSRVNFNPYHAIIECRDLMTGTLYWISPDLGSSSILYGMGFNEDAVYAHDYHSGFFYALNASDGTVKWSYEEGSYTFGPMDGVIFTCEGDVIINGEVGSVSESTLCLDKDSGEVLWTNENWFAITPNETKAAHGDRLYLIAGAINQPKQLCAVDMRNGENLYYSEELPGDGDQELPIAISPDGTIYFCRDGGVVYAVEDHGAGFSILWTYAPQSIGFIMNYGVDLDGHLLVMDNGKIRRIHKDSGTVTDSSLVSVFNSGRITVGADSLVYVNNTDGAYYALSYDLQSTVWNANYPNNYYAGPALAKEGVMILCGGGTTIRAFQASSPHKPVTDFVAGPRKIYTGESISFTDQSSFLPDAWQWEFPGGFPATSNEQHPQNIIYENEGIYEVSLISSNTLGSDTLVKHCYVEVILINDLKENDTGNAWHAFPNPAIEQVRFHPAAPNNLHGELTILSPDGKTVLYIKDYPPGRPVDIRLLKPGLYFYMVEGQSRHVGKFIKF